MLWSGHQDCNLYQAQNFVLEHVDTLPTYDSRYFGRFLFVDTPGPDYGVQYGDIFGWTRILPSHISRFTVEQKNIVSTNVIPDLVYTPIVPTGVMLYVGQVLQTYGMSFDYIVINKTVTWYPLNAGFNLESGDKVIVAYDRLEF